MRWVSTAALVVALVAALVAGALAACSEEQADRPATHDEPATSAAPAPGCPSVAYHRDELTPGCWAIRVRGPARGPVAELDLPSGFSGNDAWVWVNDMGDDEWGAITLMSVEDVHPDPCTRTGRPTRTGPSVQDLAAALTTQEVTTTTRPVPVVLDGHDGVYLEVSVPAGLDVSRCRDEEIVLWTSTEDAAGAAPGLVSRFWILDVDGQRVVLAVNTDADATSRSVGSFVAIAESATLTGR